MSLLVHPNNGTITTVIGTGSTNITAKNSILMHIFVKASTSSTTFDVKLIDIYDNIIFLREDNVGELNEQLNLPAYGNWTMTIFNASNDESFNFITAAREY